MRCNYERKSIIKREIRDVLQAYQDGIDVDTDIALAYTLNTEYGFGEKRIKAFFEKFQNARKKIIDKYEMEDDFIYLAEYKLKEQGIDVRKWYKEIKR